MFITIEHIKNIGISKFENTLRLVCSGTKPSYYFWVKGFDIRRRDTIFYAVLFIWPPSRAAPIGCKFASRLRAPKVDPPRLASSTQLSFNSLQTSARFRWVTSLAFLSEPQKSTFFVQCLVSTHLTFFQFSTNLCELPVRDVTRTPSPVSSRTIVTSLSDTLARPRALAFTPASMFAPN